MGEWEYYKDKPNQIINQKKTLVLDEMPIDKLDLNILSGIGEDNPESIKDLAQYLGLCVKTMSVRLNKLADDGFIQFKKGSGGNKIPLILYDKIEVSI